MLKQYNTNCKFLNHIVFDNYELNHILISLNQGSLILNHSPGRVEPILHCNSAIRDMEGLQVGTCAEIRSTGMQEVVNCYRLTFEMTEIDDFVEE